MKYYLLQLHHTYKLPPVYSYQNQREVAEGIKRAYKDVPGLKREDIFIVSRTIPTWDVT